jgi:hypothetical protein
VYSCGYSQPNRKHISVAYLKAGTAETDCSAGVSYWLYMGKYLNENPWFHTAIEREYLQEHGFQLIDANAGFVKMERNDVLWRPGHTALYIGEGLQAEALRDENHDAGYEGTTPGDNDGGETVVRKLTYDWDYVIRKVDKPDYRPVEPDDKEEIVPNPIGILYHAEGENSNYYWNWSPECVPFHVNGPQSESIRKMTGLQLQKIPKETADNIMSMCLARKAWREQGIVDAINRGDDDAV